MPALLSGRAGLLVACAAVAILFAAIGYAIYRERATPLEMPALTVDGQTISMGYFIKRAYIAGRQPLIVLNELASEEIVRAAASKPPFNINPSGEEFDRYLRDLARGKAATLSEAEFQEWQRQQINESRLTADEFREVMRNRLIADEMTEFLFSRMPTVSEQVRLAAIRQPTEAAAKEVATRLLAGEDFDSLARTLNDDPKLKANGGDLGWYTREELESSFASLVFDDLSVSGISPPFKFDDSGFVVVKLVEKAPAREIGESAKRVLKATLLDKWVAEQFPQHAVEFHGLNGGYDSETDAWVRAQVSAMSAATGTSP